MKNLIFIFLLATFSTFAQKKKQIIFIFEQKKDTIIFKKNERIYNLGNNQTYKFTRKKHKEIMVPYQSIKEHIFTFNDFLKLNKGKEFPKYYNDFSFYIFIRESQNNGCLIEVDKIWLVENKIIN